MPAIDPAIYTDYRAAKRAAAELAARLPRFVLLQGVSGKPQVITNTGCKKSFTTWLSVWSWLYQVLADMQKRSA